MSNGYGPIFDRHSALVRSAGVCSRCRRRFPPSLLDAHHALPRREGGPDTYGNLIPLCDACHATVEQERRAAVRRLVDARTRVKLRRRVIPPELSPRTYARPWPDPGTLADRLMRYGS